MKRQRTNCNRDESLNDPRYLEQPSLIHTDGIQYIDCKTLPYSAKFHLGDFVCELLGDKFVLFIGPNYVLRVFVGHIDGINDMVNFDEAIKVLLNHLTVDRVLLDLDDENCNKSAQNVIEHLRAKSDSALESRRSAKLLIQLLKIFHEPSHTESLVQEIVGNLFIEEPLKQYLVDHLHALKQIKNRKDILDKWKGNELFQTNTYENMMKDSIQNLMENYKIQLLEYYPSKLTEKLDKIKASLCFCVSKTDLKLFYDLENTLTENPFTKALGIIRSNFISQLLKFAAKSLEQLTPLSNPIYFLICKSLIDKSKELHKTYNINEVINFGDNGWSVQDQPDDRNLLKSILLQQTKLLVKLANFYAPGAATVNQKFPHTFIYLKINSATSEVDINEHVWLCFLDVSIGHVFSAFKNCDHLFSELIDFYKNYILCGHFGQGSSESLHFITHQLLQFITRVAAVMTSAKENPMNKMILQNQISGIMKHEVTIGELRDLLEVFTCHWKQHNSVLKSISDRLNGEIFKENVISFQKRLSEIVSCALVKNVKRSELIDFLRNFTDFLIDLEDVDLVWYVRLPKKSYVPIFVDWKLIQPVNNKWKGTKHQCYVVKNADRFEKEYTLFEDDVDLPKHYQMFVIETLLENVNNLASKKKWINGGNLTESDQLNGMKWFIGAARSLFPYLNEQYNYIQFETFIHQNVKLLVDAIDKSESSENFIRRVSQIVKYMKDIWSQNNTDIDDALKLLQGENQSCNEEILRSTYLLYKECFEDYIRGSLPFEQHAKINIIIKNVRCMTDRQLTTDWSDTFKQKTLPKILAGLAAVWSILVSKNITSSGMFPKPYIMQILCILRMLNVDQSAQGVGKHLAQVLTGQGKSVILGLSATLLALFGHNVEVICYSTYLAQRDAEDFKEMFELFSVSDRISYKTFKDMVDNQVDVYAEKGEDYICRSLGLPKTNAQYNRKQAQIHLENSVLLIDEVDVFFLDLFYGNTRNRTLLPVIEGLGEVQMKVWEIVQTGNTDTSSIKTLIEVYINTTSNPAVQKLKAFINKPEPYMILDESRVKLTTVLVNNRTLFMGQLHAMISSANNIHLAPIDGQSFSAFKLDKEGRIAVRSSLGEFTLNVLNGYHNIFAYFKLKGCDFVQNVNGTTNFGYFIITIAALSYAKLPENYPLILGVTGTLTGLNSYERNAVENHYKIQQFSIMPSFFGTSNLKFNQMSDFKCISTEADWMKAVFNRINTIVNANRSVLVFFNTELNINKFQQNFASQLDRLNIWTINTTADIKEQYINASGVAKTVTLTTREMGRGVDFKSGATVEKNGGLHVIQTFFSLDVKEETQIKGRTARKDYCGSYELIVCSEHLVNLQLIRADAKYGSVSYAQLESARKEIVEKKGEEKAMKLASSDAKHDMTVKFYKRSTSSQQRTHFNNVEAHPPSKTMNTSESFRYAREGN